MGKPGLDRESGNRSAVLGGAALRVDRTEAHEPMTGFVQCRSCRWIEKGEAARVGFSPEQRGQKQAREVRFQNFRRIMGWKRDSCSLLPQPDGDTGCLARSTAGSLGHGCAARPLGHEPRETRTPVV